jgi:hypothetical protein
MVPDYFESFRSFCTTRYLGMESNSTLLYDKANADTNYIEGKGLNERSYSVTQPKVGDSTAKHKVGDSTVLEKAKLKDFDATPGSSSSTKSEIQLP